MYPFFYEGQRIVHKQMVQDAITRGRIHAELNNRRSEPGWIWRIIRLCGRFQLLKDRQQSECTDLELLACNTAHLATVANKNNHTKFG
jgi:hypothetical protein